LLQVTAELKALLDAESSARAKRRTIQNRSATPAALTFGFKKA
jgi:hypothetical protein